MNINIKVYSSETNTNRKEKNYKVISIHLSLPFAMPLLHIYNMSESMLWTHQHRYSQLAHKVKPVTCKEKLYRLHIFVVTNVMIVCLYD